MRSTGKLTCVVQYRYCTLNYRVFSFVITEHFSPYSGMFPTLKLFSVYSAQCHMVRVAPWFYPAPPCNACIAATTALNSASDRGRSLSSPQVEALSSPSRRIGSAAVSLSHCGDRAAGNCFLVVSAVVEEVMEETTPFIIFGQVGRRWSAADVTPAVTVLCCS